MTAPTRAQIWLMAARPRTLPAAAVPVLVGSAAAQHAGHFQALPALAALLGALLLQIGANFANDYFDWKKGADTEERLGPTRVTQAGLLSPRAVVAATALAFLGATGCGLYLTAVAGWPVVAIGLVSILAALAYTGGPYPLGYHGLGEVTVFTFFGPVAVLGTFYVQALALDPLAAWLSVPVGALTAAILVVNNLRDAPTDALAGKRTIAVRWGQPFARRVYRALLTTAFVLPLALGGLGQLSLGALLVLLALPMARRLVASIHGPATGENLNPALARTAKLLLAHGLLLAAGVLMPPGPWR